MSHCKIIIEIGKKTNKSVVTVDIKLPKDKDGNWIISSENSALKGVIINSRQMMRKVSS